MSKQTVKKHGKVAFIIGITISLLGIYVLIPETQAVAISTRSLTISDSRPGVSTLYDFVGTHSSTLVSCLEIIFCANATGACGTVTGFTAASASSMPGQWSGWLPAAFTASTLTATRILYTAASTVGGGTNFSFAANTITNPTSTVATTYFGRVSTYANTQACSGTATDTGVVAFAIIDGVEITATVAETLTFSIASVTNANCDTSFQTHLGPASTASAVAFGELSLNTFSHACQDLTISTNAGSGYSLTGQEDTNLLSGSDTIDDSTGDGGGMSETATREWATATNNGFGYSCVNQDCQLENASTYKQFACVGSDPNCDPGTGGETAQNIAASSGAVNAVVTRVEYKISVDALQPSGDYANEIIYIATPTF